MEEPFSCSYHNFSKNNPDDGLVCSCHINFDHYPSTITSKLSPSTISSSSSASSSSSSSGISSASSSSSSTNDSLSQPSQQHYCCCKSCFSYNDIDLIFGMELSTAKHFDRVKTAVLDALLDLLPPTVSTILYFNKI